MRSWDLFLPQRTERLFKYFDLDAADTLLLIRRFSVLTVFPGGNFSVSDSLSFADVFPESSPTSLLAGFLRRLWNQACPSRSFLSWPFTHALCNVDDPSLFVCLLRPLLASPFVFPPMFWCRCSTVKFPDEPTSPFFFLGADVTILPAFSFRP